MLIILYFIILNCRGFTYIPKSICTLWRVKNNDYILFVWITTKARVKNVFAERNHKINKTSTTVTIFSTDSALPQSWIGPVTTLFNKLPRENGLFCIKLLILAKRHSSTGNGVGVAFISLEFRTNPITCSSITGHITAARLCFSLRFLPNIMIKYWQMYTHIHTTQPAKHNHSLSAFSQHCT